MASEIFRAFGDIQQGRAAAKMAAFQAGIAQQQADRARDQAAIDEQRFRRKSSAELASRRARFGASGIDPTSGSALLSIEDGAGIGEFDALTIRSQGLDRAFQIENQAALDLARGKAAQRQALLRAGTRLLAAGEKAGYIRTPGK